MKRPPPACCRCCDQRDRARATLAGIIARGDDPDGWWCEHPENQCHCPSRPAIERCRCAHCLSWLRRAPRCTRQGCTDYAWAGPLCSTHRLERNERRRQQAKRQADVRRPPRPPWDGEPGVCSMCGTDQLPPRRRSWCSDECVNLWLLASDPQTATAQLLELHGSTCWACGTSHREAEDWDGEQRLLPVRLELEHVRPLWSLTDDERQQLRWWLPYNLQLLCEPCHRAKTSHEAGVRAAWRRGEHVPLEPQAHQHTML